MTDKITALVNMIGANARNAGTALAPMPAETRKEGIERLADAIPSHQDAILLANKQDLKAGTHLSDALQDRLALDEARLEGAADGLRAVAALPDPVGTTIAEWTQPNDLRISRVRTPIGVIAIIYEARPLVTVDAAALCLKSGNAAILRPGSDSLHTSKALGDLMQDAFAAAGLPDGTAQVIPTADRAAVGAMLQGANGTIDVVVPRGGRSLVERVQTEARVPVIGHLEGLCHIYVDKDADPAMAKDIVVNAKMRRTGVCGAAETLLVDKAAASDLVPQLAGALAAAGCSIRADAAARALYADAEPANADDWTTEYLAPIITLGIVDGVDGAIAHIRQYGSGHTESIVTQNQPAADHFLAQVDSAVVMHNASTQFADGGQFGMGAEIGIATGRLHARGPVGAEQLTTFKYVVHGSGQTRP
ncbi:MAG: glutamate-5-semialdehyde dehydrogenase [Pseudomonadota bacterium]